MYYYIYALTNQKFSSNITKVSTLSRKKEPDYEASMLVMRNVKFYRTDCSADTYIKDNMKTTPI